MKKIQSFLLLILLLSTSTATSDTTNNLLNNSTFDDGSLNGWTTNYSGQYHDGIGNECPGLAIDNDSSGCGTSGSLALYGGGYIEQSISLADDGGLHKAEINQGFESTLSADAWFWSGSDDQVIIRQTLTDDNGNVTTQTRIVTGTTDTVYSNGYATYSDTLIVSENTQQDYTITSRIEGVDGGGITGQHNAPDVDNVTLVVDYTKPTILEQEITLEEIKIDDVIEEVWTENFTFEEFEIVETFDEPIEEVIQEEFFEEDFNIIEEEFAESEIEEFKEEEVVEEEFAQEEEVIEETEEPTEEVAENEEIEEEQVEEVAEEITEESQDVDVAEQKDSIEIQVSDNVKVEIKEVSLFNNEALDDYENVPFYKNQDIYSNVDQGFFIQADLSIYNKPFYINLTLDNYISNDVIDIKQKKLYDLRVQKMELVIELQKLRDLL